MPPNAPPPVPESRLLRALALGAVGYGALMGLVLAGALRAAATRAFYENYDGRIPVWDRLAFLGADHITALCWLISIGCFATATLPMARRASLLGRWAGASAMLSLGLGVILAWVSWDAARSRVRAAIASLDGAEGALNLTSVLEQTVWLWVPAVCALVLWSTLRRA